MRDPFNDHGNRSRRYDDADDDNFDRWPAPRRRRRRPHSGMGIASCFLAVAAGAILFFTFVFAAIVEARHGELAEDDPRTTAAGCFFLLAGGLGFVGVILGIVGVCEARRKRLFAGLGLGFNACIVLGVVTLGIIGLLMQ
jgi:hypothetical protein